MGNTYEDLLLAMILNLNVRFAILVKNLEREMFDICLNLDISEFTADKSLRIKNTRKNNKRGCRFQ
jgi:hypothetical protein